MMFESGIFRFLIFLVFICNNVKTISASDIVVKKSVEENPDNGETNGEVNSIDIENDSVSNNISCTRRQNSQLHEIRVAEHGQFPFIAAIMSHQNEYLCSGTVISNGLILTTAQCTQKPVNYVLLNATKAKKDDTTIALRITTSDRFPTFNNGETDKDIGLIYTEKHNNTIANKIPLSNFSSTRNIVDLEAFGFGLNSETSQTKDLQYIGLENRNILAVDAPKDMLRGYFDCIDTKVPTCFKDTGGPAIFNNELIGVVVKGQTECVMEITSSYAINKKLADILPIYTFKAWLEEQIKKNQETSPMDLATYPLKPERRQIIHKMTSGANNKLIRNFLAGFICLLTSLYFA